MRLVTLLGPGGVGKTRVAVAAGERLTSKFRDGVSFAALAAVDPERAVAAIADAVGAPRVGDESEALLEHLRSRRMLLVLDNCEHVLDVVAAQVVRVLESCPGVAVLTTSQVPLELAPETTFRLGPLEIATSGVEEEPAAVRMFLDRARARDASLTITDEDRRSAAELCRLVEGMPLAIELAAARVRLLGIAGLVENVRVDVSGLRSVGRDVPERQRSLRAALDWTVSLLTPTERRVFAGLGVFAASWSADQAEQMFADTLDAVEVWDATTRLLDASLVVVRGDGRLAMPERVRRHAVEVADADGSLHRHRRRHAEVVCQEMHALEIDQVFEFHRAMANIRDLLPEVVPAVRFARAHAPDLYARVVGWTAPGLSKTGNLALVANDIPTLAGSSREGPVETARLQGAMAWYHNMRFATDADLIGPAHERAADQLHQLGRPLEALVHLIEAALAFDYSGDTAHVNRVWAQVVHAAAQLGETRWEEEMARLELGLGWYDGPPPADALARRRQVLARLGVGSGQYSRLYANEEPLLAHYEGDHVRAIALGGHAIRAEIRENFYANLNLVKLLAWFLAHAGHDADAEELRTATHRLYRERTGVEFGDMIPGMTAGLDEAAERLGRNRATVQARGEALSYDALIDRALALSEQRGSESGSRRGPLASTSGPPR